MTQARTVSEILEELEELREKATPQPWIEAVGKSVVNVAIKTPDGQKLAEFLHGENDEGPFNPVLENVLFVIALVDAYPALREEIERLREALGPFARGELNKDNAKAFIERARRTLKGDEDNG